MEGGLTGDHQATPSTSLGFWTGSQVFPQRPLGNSQCHFPPFAHGVPSPKRPSSLPRNLETHLKCRHPLTLTPDPPAHL